MVNITQFNFHCNKIKIKIIIVPNPRAHFGRRDDLFCPRSVYLLFELENGTGIGTGHANDI